MGNVIDKSLNEMIEKDLRTLGVKLPAEWRWLTARQSYHPSSLRSRGTNTRSPARETVVWNTIILKSRDQQ
jgi:hypothetical protein